MTEDKIENEKKEKPTMAMDLVELARQERENLQKENERFEKNLKEMRELEASRLLGSSAGLRHDAPEISENELKKKQALDFWGDSPISDAIKKHYG